MAATSSPGSATGTPRERAVLLAVCVAASLAAGGTRPFTLPADVAVASALALAVVVLVGQRRLAARLRSFERRRDAPLVADASSTARWWPWVATVVAATGFELYNVALLPRAAHPTLSSMLDAADRTYGGHALAFACWLVLGWYLVTR
jgi:hypothetical protein